MPNIEVALCSVIRNLSEENYDRSFGQYRFLFELAQTYSQIPFDVIFKTVWNGVRSLQSRNFPFYPASLLVLRFASDAESDTVLASHSAGLRSRLCKDILEQFFDDTLGVLYEFGRTGDLLNANFIAHGANLGYIKETTIRNHILQLLTITTHPTSYDYQVDALCVLFKTAGATIDAYAYPSVVDRCIELLKGYNRGDRARGERIQVGKLYERAWVRTKIGL